MYYKVDKETLELRKVNMFRRPIILYALIMTLGFVVSLSQSCNTVEAVTEIVIKDTTFVEREFSPKNTFLYDKIQSKDKDAFVYAVKAAAERIGRPYEELMMMFYMECGMTTIKATAKNTVHPFDDGSCAYGIFQITPVCRKFMKVSYKQVQKMDEFQQLDLFVRYVEKLGKPIESFSDLYLVNFLPSYIGRPNNTSILRYYKSNPQLGKTLGEFRHIVNSKYQNWLKEYSL